LQAALARSVAAAPLSATAAISNGGAVGSVETQGGES